MWDGGICLGLGEHGDLIDRRGFHGGAYVRERHEHSVHIEYQCIFRRKEAVKFAWELGATKE